MTLAGLCGLTRAQLCFQINVDEMLNALNLIWTKPLILLDASVLPAVRRRCVPSIARLNSSLSL